ncbi:MAG TPA: hypothetical protein EYG03_06190 [Planctomycetes bacterium]|nr:hypothetical protein [Fuerstiella sp.]HIK91557.1 hypothetical protein [Planctomycetota bacterium]
MEAPILRFSLIALSLFVSTGATFQTRNFIVTAPTADIAEDVGKAAENYRRELATFWLGKPLPNWHRPCKLKVRPGSLGAGGQTTFQFVGKEVVNWNMYVQGSMERILDSVLPHEVNHTIFASYFRRPLPRWADEGAATLFEDRSEQMKQLSLLNQVIKSDRELISLRNLLTMKEYPKGYRKMLILYAEGYALADFLLQQGGRKRYLKFLADGERMGWTEAIKANYHHGGVDSLQKNWQGWVMAGMPKLRTPNGQMLADAGAVSAGHSARNQGVARPAILDEYLSKTTVRLQSPDAKSVTTSPVGQNVTVSEPAVPQRAPATNAPLWLGTPDSGQRTRLAAVVARNEFRQPAERRSANGSTAKNDSSQFRSATFQAPSPHRVTAPAASGISRQPAARVPGPATPIGGGTGNPSSSVRAGFEATQLSHHRNSDNNSFQRKHLNQERRAVTGSIPQWAGFPGQKELF